MKRSLKQACRALLAALLCLVVLAGCAGSSGKAALRYGKSEISAGLYQYFASSYKGIYRYSYSDYADNDSFWNRELSDGMTVLSFLNEQVLQNVKRTLVSVELFDRLGLRMSESDLAAIDKTIDSLEEDYADGSRNAFNKLLSAYGINRNMLRQAHIMEKKVTLLQNALFAPGGELELTDTDRDAYYRKTYSRVRLIFLNDAYRYQTDENGKYIYDPATGKYVTRRLTDAEAAEEAAKIAAVEAELKAGSTFISVMDAYSEAESYYGKGVYPNGFYLTESTAFIADVVEAAFAMEIGEVRRISGEDGTFFLLREPLDDKAWSVTENKDFFDGFDTLVKNDRFAAYLSARLADVTVDEDVVAACSLNRVTANYRF